MSRQTSPITINRAVSDTPSAPSSTAPTSIFGRIMSRLNVTASPAPAALTSLRDLS